MFEEGDNRIRDTVAPFLVTVTIGLYGYEANNGIRGYVASGESAPKVSLRQLLWKQKRSVLEESPRNEKSVISNSCSS
jgi:hypothetical protein